MSVQRIALVVKSTDRTAAVQRYSSLLESDLIDEFAIGDSGLTVSILAGVSILSGTEEALARADSLVASALVDSLATTRAQLEAAGWTITGSLGSPGSILARDADGYIMEFVEQTDDQDGD
jgi:hypothetical protein